MLPAPTGEARLAQVGFGGSPALLLSQAVLGDQMVGGKRGCAVRSAVSSLIFAWSLSIGLRCAPLLIEPAAVLLFSRRWVVVTPLLSASRDGGDELAPLAMVNSALSMSSVCCPVSF